MSRLGLVLTQPLFKCVLQAFCPVIQQVACEVDHSPSSSAEVKNDGNCISTTSVFLHGMCRNNFTVKCVRLHWFYTITTLIIVNIFQKWAYRCAQSISKAAFMYLVQWFIRHCSLVSKCGLESDFMLFCVL